MPIIGWVGVVLLTAAPEGRVCSTDRECANDEWCIYQPSCQKTGNCGRLPHLPSLTLCGCDGGTFNAKPTQPYLRTGACEWDGGVVLPPEPPGAPRFPIALEPLYEKSTAKRVRTQPHPVQPATLSAPAVCVGQTVTLKPKAGAQFPQADAGYQVFFAPCQRAGTAVSWSADEIVVAVPDGGQTGCVWLGRTADEEQERLASLWREACAPDTTLTPLQRAHRQLAGNTIDCKQACTDVCPKRLEVLEVPKFQLAKPAQGAVRWELSNSKLKAEVKLELADGGLAKALPKGSHPLAARPVALQATNLCGTTRTALLSSVAAPPRPLRGFADLHNHPFSQLGYGGVLFWGAPSGPAANLKNCYPQHGPFGTVDLLGVGAGAPFGHGQNGSAAFDGWPHWQSLSHQAMHKDWLKRAYVGGLRLTVVLGVNSELACRFIPRWNWNTGNCNDFVSLQKQLQAAIDLEKEIDADNGGPGKGWYRIVRSPAEARKALEDDVLAVVLGAEVDYPIDACRSESGCTSQAIDQGIQSLWALGVRQLFPIHIQSSGVGGSAVYNAAAIAASIRNCADAGYQHYANGPIPTLFPACNALGLTPAGEEVIRAAMRRHLVIDVNHMSRWSADRTLQLTTPLGYPVIAGHTGFLATARGDRLHEANLAPEQVEAIRQSGGLVAPIIEQGELNGNVAWRRADGGTLLVECGRSVETFAQSYLYAVDAMKGAPVAIGTDMNGYAGQPGPRYCIPGSGWRCNPCGGDFIPGYQPKGRVQYPFQSRVGGQWMDRSVVGNKVFDVNVDGTAHVGMLPDLIEEMVAYGVPPADLEPLFRSAEGYVVMWEKVEATVVP